MKFVSKMERKNVKYMKLQKMEKYYMNFIN